MSIKEEADSMRLRLLAAESAFCLGYPRYPAERPHAVGKKGESETVKRVSGLTRRPWRPIEVEGGEA